MLIDQQNNTFLDPFSAVGLAYSQIAGLMKNSVSCLHQHRNWAFIQGHNYQGSRPCNRRVGPSSYFPNDIYSPLPENHCR
ncbi:hypothetical protein GDO86_006064 [Hymenochirus boettgeri]|uniref:Uncharacterized protein n=1 Tax=Hymenochirus boettgeri TaxID=247094 RepID=A0A8T2JCF0_9PIPI|nr:hypothetical protein GDO86_006064 [Hymenochirus boettgeri]